jgi:hypothetical protein
MKSVIGVSALSIITILGKSLASGLYSVKVPLNESFKSKPTFPAISIVVLFFLTSGLASTFGINYDGDGFCGFSPKNYPEINDAEPLAKTNYDGGSLFDGFIPNYDAKINDTNPLKNHHHHS